MAAGSNPEVTSIIAVLVGMGSAPPEPGRGFGEAMQAHNLASPDPFGQALAPLLPAVQHDDTVGLLGVAHHISDYGLL